jgi:hypothetical protein
MARFLAPIFALLLAISGAVSVPVPRIATGRDSSAIVWIAEQNEQVPAPRPKQTRRAAVNVPVRSRVFSRTPIHDLFQRPPPPCSASVS